MENKNVKLTPKEKFNALSNAKHVFALKEEGTPFQLVDIINNDDGCKCVIVYEDGAIDGLFTDSRSATSSLNDVASVFGSDQPFIKMHVKETKKGQTVYYAEVL